MQVTSAQKKSPVGCSVAMADATASLCGEFRIGLWVWAGTPRGFYKGYRVSFGPFYPQKGRRQNRTGGMGNGGRWYEMGWGGENRTEEGGNSWKASRAQETRPPSQSPSFVFHETNWDPRKFLYLDIKMYFCNSCSHTTMSLNFWIKWFYLKICWIKMQNVVFCFQFDDSFVALYEAFGGCFFNSQMNSEF